MLKRHEDALNTRLEAVTEIGWAAMYRWELRRWSGKERIGKAFWRDLRDRFHEENEGSDLYIYDGGGDQVLLIHSDGLSVISEDGLVAPSKSDLDATGEKNPEDPEA